MKIEVSDLSKRFGPYTAVSHLSFDVNEGEVLGFLGPNGAGKSTTMKMLTGFLEPTAGTINICGYDIIKEPLEAKRIIGYLPEGAPAYGEMSVVEFLSFIIDVRGLAAKKKESIERVIEILELQSVLHKPIDTLSKGFKRRVGLAQALIHDPKVLVMDEPTDGLDPNQKHQVRELITSLTKDKIVIISTHILEEVSAVCTRTLIIAQGKLLINATPSELLARSRYYNAVSMEIADPGVIQKLEKLAEVIEVKDNGDGHITVFPKDNSQKLYPLIDAMIRENNWKINNLHLESGRLDEVFRNITAGVSV